MKRVIMFGGRCQRPVFSLNDFLAKHPGIELLDIKPMEDWDHNNLVFCMVDIPENIRGLSEQDIEYFGLKAQEQEGSEA